MDILSAAEAAGNAGSAGGDGYWRLALILAGIGFLGLFARWRKARMPPPLDTREFRNRDQDPNKYRDYSDRAIVELLEASRAINAQVDSKIRMLNRLVKDAETQAARLEALLAPAAAGGPAGAAGAGAGGAGQTPAAAAAAAAAAVAATAPRFKTELHERIFRLHNDGGSVAEIARATNLSTTEVRFALAAAVDAGNSGDGGSQDAQ